MLNCFWIPAIIYHSLFLISSGSIGRFIQVQLSNKASNESLKVFNKGAENAQELKSYGKPISFKNIPYVLVFAPNTWAISLATSGFFFRNTASFTLTGVLKGLQIALI